MSKWIAHYIFPIVKLQLFNIMNNKIINIENIIISIGWFPNEKEAFITYHKKNNSTNFSYIQVTQWDTFTETEKQIIEYLTNNFCAQNHLTNRKFFLKMSHDVLNVKI